MSTRLSLTPPRPRAARRTRSRAAVLAAGVFGAACGASSLPTTPATPAPALAPYLPTAAPAGGPWATISARAVGWDSAALAAAVDYSGAHATTALIVLHQGRIVTERYWHGWTPSTAGQIASAGKSVAAVLVGALHGAGRVRLDAPVTDVVGPGWSRADAALERAVTVRHLLAMSSGLDAALRYAAAPGTRFSYNNPA